MAPQDWHALAHPVTDLELFLWFQSLAGHQAPSTTGADEVWPPGEPRERASVTNPLLAGSVTCLCLPRNGRRGTPAGSC